MDNFGWITPKGDKLSIDGNLCDFDGRSKRNNFNDYDDDIWCQKCCELENIEECAFPSRALMNMGGYIRYGIIDDVICFYRFNFKNQWSKPLTSIQLNAVREISKDYNKVLFDVPDFLALCIEYFDLNFFDGDYVYNNMSDNDIINEIQSMTPDKYE